MTEARAIDDVIAAQVRRYRLLKEWSIKRLAEECDRLGAPQLTVSSLGNIERGQDPDAKRPPRRVGAAELAVLAAALDVPPILLMFPVGQQEAVEVLPGMNVNTWTAAKWWSGEAPLMAYGADGRQYVDDKDLDAWERGAAPAISFRWHELYLRERNTALIAVTSAENPDMPEKMRADLAERAPFEREHLKQVEQQLRDLRQYMRRIGVTPPSLPSDLGHIDYEPPTGPPLAFGRPPLRPGPRP